MLLTVALCSLMAVAVTAQSVHKPLEITEGNTKVTLMFNGAYFAELGFYDDMSDAEFQKLMLGYREQCRECEGTPLTTFIVGNSCNVYVQCVDYGHILVMHAQICNLGLVHYPMLGRCEEPGKHPSNCSDPCYTLGRDGRPIKLPAALNGHCGQYQTCEDFPALTLGEGCSNGLRLSALTNECDLTCRGYTNVEIEVNSTCEAADDNLHYMAEPLYERTLPDGSKEYRTGAKVERGCPAGMEHINKNTCQCSRVNQTGECKDTEIVHLSSENNSWRLARANTPLAGTSAITGNATITNTSDAFPDQAFFTERTTFFAHGVQSNDLGLQFKFSFEFLARTPESGYQTSGVTLSNDRNRNNDIALADNSVCNIPPTYGCKLRYISENRGLILCYMSPLDLPDANRTIVSPEVDLTRRITVTFSRDDTVATLDVAEERRPPKETVYDYNFPKGVHADGNTCPLTLASGSDKRYFTGYMDKMSLVKLCKPFISRKN